MPACQTFPQPAWCSTPHGPPVLPRRSPASPTPRRWRWARTRRWVAGGSGGTAACVPRASLPPFLFHMQTHTAPALPSALLYTHPHSLTHTQFCLPPAPWYRRSLSCWRTASRSWAACTWPAPTGSPTQVPHTKGGPGACVMLQLHDARLGPGSACVLPGLALSEGRPR